VMKGVSMRFGGFQGGVEKQISPIDEGNFILTNKRIVFVGEKKISRVSTYSYQHY